MPVRERPADGGARRGREMELMVGREIRGARRMAGVSQDRLGALTGLSGAEIGRIERGQAPWLSIRTASAVLSVVGLKLWAQTFPIGSPLRDAAHLRLLRDFERRLAPSIAVEREWPIPASTDRRAIDLRLTGLPQPIGVEAETVLDDLQALEREIHLKKRDTGLERFILLVRASHRNRAIVRGAPGLRRSFPLDTRTVLAALERGADPGADGLVLI